VITNAKSTQPPQVFGLDRLETPIGIALLVTDSDGILCALDWEDYAPRMKELLRLHHGAVVLNEVRAPKEMRSALSGYFKGDRASPARRSSTKSGPRCQAFRLGPR